MEGARRTLSRWREPEGLSQDGEARGLSSDGGSQITLSGWRELWRKRRVLEKEVQQGDSGHCSQSAGEASRDQPRRLSATNLLSQPALPMMDQQCHFILHTT